MTKKDSEVTQRLWRVARYHGLETSGKEEHASEGIRQSLNARILEECEYWSLPEWRHYGSSSDDTEKGRFLVDRSVVGGVGCKCYGVCDTLGMVSTFSGAGSLNIIVPENQGTLTLERNEEPMLNLLSTIDQIYHFEKTVEAVDFTRLVYHGCDEEAIYNEIQLQNHSLEKTEFTFYVYISPVSPRGFDPIESITFDESNMSVVTNGNMALLCSQKPSSVMLTTVDSPEIDTYLREQEERIDEAITAQSGLATALLRYDVELDPAERSVLYFVSPLKESEPSEEEGYALDRTVRIKAVEKWYKFLSSTSIDDLPDEDLSLVLNQAKARIAMQIYSTLHSESSNDSSVLIASERVRAMLALARMDSGPLIDDIFRSIIDSTLSFIRERNAIDSSTIWAILKLASYENPSNPDDKLEHLIDETYRVLLEKEVPRFEPEERVVDDVDVQDESVAVQYNNAAPFETILESFWCWALVDEMLRTNIGKEEAERLADAGKSVKTFFKENLALIGQKREAIENQDAEGLYWITKAAADIALVKPDSLDLSAVDNIMDYYLERILDAPRCQHPTSGVLGNHFLRVASYYAYKRYSQRTANILERVVTEANRFAQVPNTITQQGVEYPLQQDGSISAAADLILLTQTMLLSEQDGNLLVFPSIVAKWYASKEAILVSEIPSSFGRVTLEVGTSKNQHQLELTLKHLPEEMLIFIPLSFSISMAKAFGGTIIERVDDNKNPYLRVIPLTESIVLAFPK